jgi:hypothetical protein
MSFSELQKIKVLMEGNEMKSENELFKEREADDNEMG